MLWLASESARASSLDPRAQYSSSEHQVVLEQHPAAVLDLLHLRHGAGEMVGFRELGGRRTEDILEGIAGFQRVQHLLAGEILACLVRIVSKRHHRIVTDNGLG